MSEGVNATVNQLIDVGQALTPGLIQVINDHLEENIPMILEGDFCFLNSQHHLRIKK